MKAFNCVFEAQIIIVYNISFIIAHIALNSQTVVCMYVVQYHVHVIHLLLALAVCITK